MVASGEYDWAFQRLIRSHLEYFDTVMCVR